VYFVDIYTGEAGTYARVLRSALDEIGLSLTVPSLRGFFSLDVAFRGISWPSALPLRMQLPLVVSVSLLASEYTLMAWRIAYYQLLHDRFNNRFIPPPLRVSVKRRAAWMIETIVLFAAPLYELARDGTGVTDEDLLAWVENNPDATSVDITGLSSITLGTMKTIFYDKLPHAHITLGNDEVSEKITKLVRGQWTYDETLNLRCVRRASPTTPTTPPRARASARRA